MISFLRRLDTVRAVLIIITILSLLFSVSTLARANNSHTPNQPKIQATKTTSLEVPKSVTVAVKGESTTSKPSSTNTLPETKPAVTNTTNSSIATSTSPSANPNTAPIPAPAPSTIVTPPVVVIPAGPNVTISTDGCQAIINGSIGMSVIIEMTAELRGASSNPIAIPSSGTLTLNNGATVGWNMLVKLFDKSGVIILSKSAVVTANVCAGPNF